MQPNLMMNVFKHNICFLQHQVCNKRNTIGYEWLKHINEKLHSNVQQDLVASNHTITVAFRHRAASHLAWLVEEDEKGEFPDHLPGVPLKIGVEPSQIVPPPA
ncbi:hypothetical protein TNCV_4213601 [Trichonephila clavipes]|nr:hypothetical protein TNCV_4213601 [Trichonephila clavipes]